MHNLQLLLIYKMDLLNNVVLSSDMHTTQLLKTFDYFCKHNVLTDVTLVGDDKARVEAHKLVLCAGSSMFRNFLVDTLQSPSMIYLKGIKQEQLDSILQFLYFGETTISQDALNNFLQVCKELEIEGLDTNFEDYFNEDVDERVEHEDLESNDKLTVQEVSREAQENFESNESDQLDLQYNVANIQQNKVPRGTIIFKCIECDFSGLTKESLKKHNSFFHASDEIEMKSESFEPLQDSENIGNTYENIAGGLQIGCFVCDFVAKTRKEYRLHLDKYHSYLMEDSRYVKCKCTVCDKECSDFNTLRRHNDSIHLKKSLECNQCSYVASRRDTLKAHIMMKHEKRGTFVCNECSFSCMRPWQLKSHMSEKHKEQTAIVEHSENIVKICSKLNMYHQ